MGVASIEKCPEGLDPRWAAVWRLSRDELKEAGSFSASVRPLLDEFVFALKGAEEARVGFKWLSALEEYAELASEDLPAIAWSTLDRIASGLPTQWDRHAKRAATLAELLGLTPKARRALGKRIEGAEDGEQNQDPFAGLDEVAEKRKAKTG